MFLNLEIELVKKGYKQNQIPKLLASTVACTERTAKNKLEGKTAFTVLEAFAINKSIFENEQSIEFLFSEVNTPPQTA